MDLLARKIAEADAFVIGLDPQQGQGAFSDRREFVDPDPESLHIGVEKLRSIAIDAELDHDEVASSHLPEDRRALAGGGRCIGREFDIRKMNFDALVSPTTLDLSADDGDFLFAHIDPLRWILFSLLVHGSLHDRSLALSVVGGESERGTVEKAPAFFDARSSGEIASL